MLKRFAILIACMLPFIGMGGTLYWQVGGNPAHDGDTTNPEIPILDGTPLPMIIPEDSMDYGVRLRVVGEGVEPDTFIPFIFDDGSTFDGSLGAIIDHDGGGSGYFGTGINMSPIDDDLSKSYIAEFILCTFIDDGTEEGNYKVDILGVAEAVSRSDLEKFVSYDPIFTSPKFVWTVNEYSSVPEPSSSLLLLVGASLLALKRKKDKVQS